MNNYAPSKNLNCVHCGFDYVHIIEVECYKSTNDCYGKNKIVEISPDLSVRSIELTESISVGHRCREMSVNIAFKCEGCANEWRQSFQFHKGQIADVVLVDGVSLNKAKKRLIDSGITIVKELDGNEQFDMVLIIQKGNYVKQVGYCKRDGSFKSLSDNEYYIPEINKNTDYL